MAAGERAARRPVGARRWTVGTEARPAAFQLLRGQHGAHHARHLAKAVRNCKSAPDLSVLLLVLKSTVSPLVPSVKTTIMASLACRHAEVEKANELVGPRNEKVGSKKRSEQGQAAKGGKGGATASPAKNEKASKTCLVM